MADEFTYRDAGVDIDEAARAVERIKPLAASTARPEVLAGIGGFGASFLFPAGKYEEPVLLSGTDGVGTKLQIARAMGVHDTIGIDLVAMCVNDILTSGAEPLFFLDYISIGRTDAVLIEQIAKGIAEGCRQAGCALIGGEIAEHPGVMEPADYDLAGFVVGVVERAGMIDGSGIEASDALIGLPSSGLHSNGFSLVRKLVEAAGVDYGDDPFDTGRPLGLDLLVPTVIYRPHLEALQRAVSIKGLAHITGGGLTENVVRMLPEGAGVVLREGAWERPAVYDMLQRLGSVSEAEMRRTFNLGVGMVCTVSEGEKEAAIAALEAVGCQARVIGEVSADPGVVFD